MSRKDYQLVLDVIAREYHRVAPHAKLHLERLVKQFGDTYEAAFDNFNRSKWDAEWELLRQPIH